MGVVVTVGLTAAVGAVDGTGGRAGDPSGTDGGTTFLLSGLSRERVREEMEREKKMEGRREIGCLAT